MFDRLAVIIPWVPSEDCYRTKSLEIVSKNVRSMSRAELVLGTDDSIPLNRSKARNNAAKDLDREFLLILDADTFVPAVSILLGINSLENGSSWVIPYNTYYNLSKDRTDEILTGDSLSMLANEPVDGEYDHKILSWAGALLMRMTDFNKIGGYDERFKGWGWEDVAFRLAADNVLGKHVRVGSFVSHLWHNRPLDFGSEEERDNALLFKREYEKKFKWKDERVG